MTDLLATIVRHENTSIVELHRLYRTEPDDLWDALVSPERAARWLGEVTGELHEGGHYLIVFDESDPTALVKGEIRRCVPGQELEVTWQAPGDGVSVVKLQLTPTEGGTDLHLVHSGLDQASDTGHAAGWQVHLDQLANGIHDDDWSDQWDAWKPLQEAYSRKLSASHPD